MTDLSSNNSLHTIHFHDIVLSLGGWVLDALAKIKSPSLRAITLNVFSDDHGELPLIDAFDWHALTTLLSNAPFSSSLKKVQVTWFGYYADHDLTTQLEERLVGKIPGTECVVGVDLTRDVVLGVTNHERLFDRC